MSRTHNTDPYAVQVLRYNKRPIQRKLDYVRRWPTLTEPEPIVHPPYYGGYWRKGKEYRQLEHRKHRAETKAKMAHGKYDDIYEPKKNLGWLLW